MILSTKNAPEIYKSLNLAMSHMAGLRDSLSRRAGGTASELGEYTLVINVIKDFMCRVKEWLDDPSFLDANKESPTCTENFKKEDSAQMATHIRRAKDCLSTVHEANRTSGNSSPGGLGKLSRVIKVLDRLWAQEMEK